MYQITTQSGVVGYTETPEYCYKLSSGSPQVLRFRDRAKAAGVVFAGKIYNLPGHADFDAETATVSEVDGGAAMNRQMAQINALREENAALEDAMCEQDAANEDWKANIEDALCEISAESEE